MTHQGQLEKSRSGYRGLLTLQPMVMHLPKLEEKTERCLELHLPTETDSKGAGRNQPNHVKCSPVPQERHSTTTTDTFIIKVGNGAQGAKLSKVSNL